MGGIAGIIQAAQQQVDSQLNSFAQAGQIKAQARQLEYQADVAKLNSKMAQYQGQIAQSDDYLNNYRAMGRQAAAQAQGGILGSPTGQGLLLESESEALKSARRIRLGADQQKTSFLVDSIGLRSQAQGMKRNARVSILEGFAGPAARAVMDPFKIAGGLS